MPPSSLLRTIAIGVGGLVALVAGLFWHEDHPDAAAVGFAAGGGLLAWAALTYRQARAARAARPAPKPRPLLRPIVPWWAQAAICAFMFLFFRRLGSQAALDATVLTFLGLLAASVVRGVRRRGTGEAPDEAEVGELPEILRPLRDRAGELRQQGSRIGHAAVRTAALDAAAELERLLDAMARSAPPTELGAVRVGEWVKLAVAAVTQFRDLERQRAATDERAARTASGLNDLRAVLAGQGRQIAEGRALDLEVSLGTLESLIRPHR
jgi:hypothetical protein